MLNVPEAMRNWYRSILLGAVCQEGSLDGDSLGIPGFSRRGGQDRLRSRSNVRVANRRHIGIRLCSLRLIFDLQLDSAIHAVVFFVFVATLALSGNNRIFVSQLAIDGFGTP